MEQKKYSVMAISKAQTSWIEKNYDFLKESYLQKGYDSKMLFANYCIQRFDEAYNDYEKAKFHEIEMRQFNLEKTHETSF